MHNIKKLNKTKGELGEKLIAEYLEKQGYDILEKNFHIKGGEIDIIAKKENIFAFIEVKYRTISPKFSISLIITPEKQRRVILAAQHYLAIKKIQHQEHIIRFDVAFLCDMNIEYIENAFTKK